VREPIRPRFKLSLGGSLLDLAFTLDTDGVRVDLDAVRAALARKKRWVELDDHSLTEISDALADLVDDAGEALVARDDGGGAVSLPLHQLGRVERWTLDADVARDAAAAALRERLQAMQMAKAPTVSAALASVLRPYQRDGVAWLQFLAALGAGGVLADDMGLGKTVMTLSLLASMREARGAAPSLVVCPTSVASNWVAEAARFTPDLLVCSLSGAAAIERRSAALTSADLVVTTYGLLRRDVELLRSVAFRVVVLDEAQTIKNIDAATTRAARALRAEMKLCLTGTPIENRLSELWSILDFCNPGILGTRRTFETRFERPLSASVAEGAPPERAAERNRIAARLRALLRPFVLRRTRAEVLPELPPRQEIDLHCPIAPSHRRRYDALAVALRDEVRAFMSRDTHARAGIALFTALLRLRQMACDPRLIDPRDDIEGSKRAVFMATVQELIAAGRRALVFSQFTELLTLWRADLDRAGVRYEYLDGGTRDRDAAIARFQSGDAPLFLISLKAGGAGLNLTAADTVIHCDPWWNPAVEDQATARAHRLGQTRGVIVYRLVARGTVEDRVIALKDRKRALADALIAENVSHDTLAGLSADDLALLLANADADEDESTPDA
jgi:SNF2 family DNA or RNA helicase